MFWPLLELAALVCLLVALMSKSARASEGPLFSVPDPLFLLHQPDHYVAVDLLVFSQYDHGGDPLADEGFRYEGASIDVRYRPSERINLRGTAVVAALQNNPVLVLPSSVTNGHITSASTDFSTLDSSFAADFLTSDGNWIVTPGFFYHHQWAYLAGGMDLDVRRILAGGDTIVRLAFNTRFASLRQVNWDNSPVHGDHRITNNVIAGITQTFSPHLIGNLGAQYTAQTGLLYSTLQYVGLYNAQGQPVELVSENLPRERDRGQVNGRLRYTPWVGTSFGLDASGYYDDWDLLNVAIEPSLETGLPGGIRFRAWYRLSDQKATKYFAATPQVATTYMTQNSNLGSFVMQSPGLLFLVPLDRLGADPGWMFRLSALGFYRSDRLYGLGGSMGVSFEW